MTITSFLSSLEPSRTEALSSIHNIIINEDKTIEASVGKMMGKEMLIYTAKGTFKYGLSSNKNYMSLHIMPIYGSSKLHEKYSTLLNQANFQKGCINFKNRDEMPLSIVTQLIADCAKVDLAAMMEAFKKSKKNV